MDLCFLPRDPDLALGVDLRDDVETDNKKLIRRPGRITDATGRECILGIPIVSGLLAHGAVVYSQRRSIGQKLSVLQLFTLANREWLNPLILWKGTSGSNSVQSSLYLWLAVFLILITAVQPPLQSILVRDENMSVVTCKGHPAMHSNFDIPKVCRYPLLDPSTEVIAWDSEPIGLNFCPQNVVVERTSQKIISATREDTQTYLWSDPPYPNRTNENRQTLRWHYAEEGLHAGENHPYFVSSVANGTSTGVYRHHAIRMDSKAKCYEEKSFPDRCKGGRPFEASFSHGELKIDICVEGSYDTVPWNTSRDKQEHSERLWLSLNWNREEYLSDRNYSLRCESVSRRGWFELPNYANNGLVGPLLDEWPSQWTLAHHYNDYYVEGSSREKRYPEKEVPKEDLVRPEIRPGFPIDAFNTEIFMTPGPLMTAALAMFGNTTFFHLASVADEESYNQTIIHMCAQPTFPFRGLFRNMDVPWCNYPFYDIPTIDYFIGEYFYGFSDSKVTEQALEMAMFFANEALLTTTARQRDADFSEWRKNNIDARPIYFNAGSTVTKPKKDMAAVICITVFIGLQVIGLCLLMGFILHTPTWTNTLDADALAQIGGQLKEWGEPRPELRDIPGVVGVDETRRNAESLSVRLSTSQDGSLQSRPAHLSLGGEGLVNRSAMKGMRANSTVIYS
ncbi:hypothetical protein FSARC_8147 [Fusarium sarcochroum]|uniref:Uncharacterized protein n=1 Tax=Fusarium sarcochroum TaxID=1208366 RepID=A0A8H4TTY7_9HYPO|nr:hypothetical protein FSARC_8147 [Fusarium sarcochroum]